MKNNKMNARRTKSTDGIWFQSAHEAHRWNELRILEHTGMIQDLRRQVRYELVPAQYEEVERISPKTGKRLKPCKRCVERAVDYYADFVYYDMKNGVVVVEDAKGHRTKDYIIKRKLMLYLKGIRVKES